MFNIQSVSKVTYSLITKIYYDIIRRHHIMSRLHNFRPCSIKVEVKLVTLSPVFKIIQDVYFFKLVNILIKEVYSRGGKCSKEV